MGKILLSASFLAMGAGVALAGGVDRSGQSLGFMFEKGGYAEFSIGRVAPDVSGVATAFSPTPGGASGDMASDYSTMSFALKQDLNEHLSIGATVDQPFGANVSYPTLGYYAAGSLAKLSSQAVTGVAKYRFDNNVSVLGGVRIQKFEADAAIPFVAQYNGNSDPDVGYGYVFGVAYEKPEIALRVALTYNSKIKHELDTKEALFNGGFPLPDSVTTVETPASVNLEFQSGVAANTLVFGSVRWVDWSNFVIDPAGYPPTTPIVSYDSDTISYSLGVGRKFNENWSGAVTLGYEGATGGFASNLGPTDGYKSIGVGATYTKEAMKVAFGVRYVDIGDAQTTLVGGLPSANFSGNHALGYGVRVSFSF